MLCFSAGWENRMLERLRFKDREQKGKATYHDRNERYAFELEHWARGSSP